MGKRRRGTVERFWEKVNRDGDGGCWLWTGGTTGPPPPAGRGGYGRFWADGHQVLAHRYAYELLVGPIPEGLTLDHVRERGCTHRHCVNPAHLEPVTNRENILRGTGLTARHAARTHCKDGHELVPAPSGRQRFCPVCAREIKRRSAERRWDDYAARRRELARLRYQARRNDPAFMARRAANALASYYRRKEFSA